jgi:hypothetical protein
MFHSLLIKLLPVIILFLLLMLMLVMIVIDELAGFKIMSIWGFMFGGDLLLKLLVFLERVLV